MMDKEYFDGKGRTIRTENVDGITRMTFESNANANEYVAGGRKMTTADLLAMQKDPRYKSDPHFREAVYANMRLSEKAGTKFEVGGNQEFGVLERAMAADNANSDNILEQREEITHLFSDPRYAKSPAFRTWVKEQVRQSDPRHHTDLGGVYRYDAPVKETGQFAPAPENTDEGSPK
jgi:hypothetical protein